MNRVVFLMDTGRAATLEAAAWFIAHGDRVYLGVRTLPEIKTEGIEYLILNPLDEEGLQQTVKTVEEQCGRLDILVIGAGLHPKDGEIGTGHDYDQMADTIAQNVYGCNRTVEAFLPLLQQGMKRIASITEIESSNSWSTGKEDLAYHASLASINMLGKILFNKLRPEGFTFRWYCDDGVPGGMCAADYMTAGLCYDPKEPYIHSDENRLVLRDAYLREISW